MRNAMVRSCAFLAIMHRTEPTREVRKSIPMYSALLYMRVVHFLILAHSIAPS